MFGWSRLATVRASVRYASASLAWAINRACATLIATSRCQLVVVGEVNEAEAAFAEDFLDPVATDPLRLFLRGTIDSGDFRSSGEGATVS